MLNEKLNIRYCIGSSRAGSARVGSARSSIGRVSSARPSVDTNRPKLHVGRPSSAPVVPRRPSSAPAQGGSTHLYSKKTGAQASAFHSYSARKGGYHTPHVKSHDVSHLNLKVEGKSIRSVSYAPRRHLPVSRGTLRVVSSHAYSSARKQNKVCLRE
ncbi:hypothetical protein SK128_025204 [Halocaridina rubra]|uniref:Uncharacterized protein n=1 Tax=Halocaridina rubra TaxID=373956 RepID=A0AAN8XJV7_HALRR